MCALIVVMPVIGPADDSAGVPQAVRRGETVHWSQEGRRLSGLGVSTRHIMVLFVHAAGARPDLKNGA